MNNSFYLQAKPADAKAACSSVRNGAFHGRNLDLFYNEGVEVVVRMAAGKDRFASIAVCGGNPEFNDEKIANGTVADYAKIPLLMQLNFSRDWTSTEDLEIRSISTL